MDCTETRSCLKGTYCCIVETSRWWDLWRKFRTLLIELSRFKGDINQLWSFLGIMIAALIELVGGICGIESSKVGRI